MRHYKMLNDGYLVAIGTGAGGEEITESEYKTLLTEIREKAALVNQLYSGEITIDAVPTEWQEEIQRRVNERIAMEEETAETVEATEADYIAALAELGVPLNE